MLVTFSVAEYHAISEPATVSLRASSLSIPEWVRTVPTGSGTRPEILNCVGCFFGPNGSGKTLLLKALSELRLLMVQSAQWNQSATTGLPARQSDLKRGKFAIEFLNNSERVTLSIYVDGGKVREEEVFVRQRRRLQLLYRRCDDNIEFGALLRNLRVSSYPLPSGVSLLGVLAGRGVPIAMQIMAWFGANLRLADASNRSERWALTSRLLHEERTAPLIRMLLAGAGLGIVDVLLDEVDEGRRKDLDQLAARWHRNDRSGVQPAVDPQSLGITLVHRRKFGATPVPMNEQSAGTRAWLGAVGIIVDSLLHGSVLLADEIEASLDPSLVRAVIRIFQFPETNPNGAQLLTNTHDVSLLENTPQTRVLARDQIWLFQREEFGEVSLRALSSFGPRSNESLGKRYLSGYYTDMSETRIPMEPFAAEIASVIANLSVVSGPVS